MAPTAIEKLESERESTKSLLEYLESELTNDVTTPLTEAEVDHLLSLTRTAQTDIIDNQKKIQSLYPASIADHQRDFQKCLGRATKLLGGFTGIKMKLSSKVPPLESKSATFGVKLRPLELPTFDGSLHEWAPFRDMFVKTIHDEVSLSKAQKLTYLKSLVIGEASRQIKSMLLTDANYDIAWSQLTNRYQNDRELLFSILRRFVAQPNLLGNSSTAIHTLIDVSNECIRSLSILNLPTDQWDALLMFHIHQKLDPTSKELFEQGLKDSDIPKLQELVEFLEQRARILTAGGQEKSVKSSIGVRNEYNHKKVAHVHHTHQSHPCKICSISNHPVFKCTQFHSMTITDKLETVRKLSPCYNCLNEGHVISKCSSTGVCRLCKGKHHTLIHKDKAADAKDSTPVLNHHSNEDTNSHHAILATAVVTVTDVTGRPQFCRALLDGGSTSSFITESCSQRLGLKRSHNAAEIIGLASSSIGAAKGVLTMVVKPHFTSTEFYVVNALVLNQVTGNLPVYQVNQAQLPHLSGLKLADPEFHAPAKIDILLGSDVFWNILSDGRKSGPRNSPVAINSTLGWLVAGKCDDSSKEVLVHYADTELDKQVQRFWEIESISTKRDLTIEEKECEAHFHSTYSRDADGRFVVQLPWKNPKPILGSSRELALRRLKQLEKRLFASNASLSMQAAKHQNREDYIKFMREYLVLGHMSLIPDDEIRSPSQSTYYIPHHFVKKECSTTTKFRVVFDGSAKSSSGNSLNDALMVGPTIQDSLMDILIRFRIHVIAFTADIAKMYRMIRISPEGADMQRILWRESPNERVKEYRLLTVTYGTASAPYLATKSLQQLALDEEQSLPLASKAAREDFYVDDLKSGAPTIEEALQLQSQLIQLAGKGGFDLRKWSSNCQPIVQAVPPEMRDCGDLLNIKVDPVVKLWAFSGILSWTSFNLKLSSNPQMKAV